MTDEYLISLDVTDDQHDIFESFYFAAGDEGYPYLTKFVSAAKRYDSNKAITVHNVVTKIFRSFQTQLAGGLFQIPFNERKEILGDCADYVYEAEAMASQVRHSRASAVSGSRLTFEVSVNKIDIRRNVTVSVSSDFCDPEVQQRQQRYQEYLKLKEEFGNC